LETSAVVSTQRPGAAARRLFLRKRIYDEYDPIFK
jgi:hypothetical protein